MPHKQIEACRACGNPNLVDVLDLGMQSLTGVFPESAEVDVPRAPLELVKCHGSNACGLAQLRHSVASELLYGSGYGYRSSLNSTMVDHLRTVVEDVMAVHRPDSGSIILDIGSNDGTTLRQYPSSRYQLIGIDPTAGEFSDGYPAESLAVEGFFSESLYRSVAPGGRDAALVTSIAMFYDLEAPMDFMRQVYAILKPEGIWVFEQSYLPLMLERNAFDTVCHEHLLYYSLGQVAWMAERVGFEFLDVEFNDVNGGSFRITARKPDKRQPVHSDRVQEAIHQEQLMGLTGLDLYRDFADRVRAKRDEVQRFLAKARSTGKSVAALGASTKGNVLLQYCEITPRDISAVGEVNSWKFGRYTPGTGVPIVPEDVLLSQNPDFLLVLPWHFRETFLRKPRGKTSRLVFPLPDFEIVG